MKFSKLGHAIASLGLLAFASGSALAQSSDQADSNLFLAPEGSVGTIPAMTVEHAVMDFDAMPAGATTVADIQAAFPGSSLDDITFTTRDEVGSYNFQTGGGRALAATDLAGNLGLVDPPAGAFNAADDVTIDLFAPATEFGFEMGDWAGPVNVEFSFDGSAIASITVDTSGDDRDHFFQTTSPFDSVNITAFPQNPPANWVLPALYIQLGEGSTPGSATFLTSKDFNDDNEAEVEVTLSCNTGLPLEQTTTISEGDPVNFVIGDFEPGTLDCEITEVVPDGYTASYDNGEESSETSCAYADIIGDPFTCEITNTLDPVEIDVTKVWIDENPQFNAQNIANANWCCTNVSDAGEGFGVLCGASGFLDFNGNPDTDSFQVLPDWEDGTTCSITEVDLFESGVEVDDSECQGLVVFPGGGTSCTIYNTRLYEGIPTLSQYGLGILALLMLGVGFVAFRRVI